MSGEQQEIADYYRTKVGELCMAIGIAAGLIAGIGVTVLAYIIPPAWLHVFYSLAWIPPLLVGCLAHITLRDRIEKRCPRRPTPNRGSYDRRSQK